MNWTQVMDRPRTMNKHAFTTLELLLATALAAVMMVGVLRVVGSIRPELDTRRRVADANWSIQLVDLLRWDLTNARIIWQQENKLTLVGYDALDRSHFGWRGGSEGSSVHQPVKVEYYLWSNQDGDSWLLRRQIHTTEQTNRNAWSEVVVRDVESFEIRRPAGLIDPVDPLAATLWLNQPGPVPPRANLVVRLVDDVDPILDTLIVVQ